MDRVRQEQVQTHRPIPPHTVTPHARALLGKRRRTGLGFPCPVTQTVTPRGSVGWPHRSNQLSPQGLRWLAPPRHVTHSLTPGRLVSMPRPCFPGPFGNGLGSVGVFHKSHNSSKLGQSRPRLRSHSVRRRCAFTLRPGLGFAWGDACGSCGDEKSPSPLLPRGPAPCSCARQRSRSTAERIDTG